MSFADEIISNERLAIEVAVNDNPNAVLLRMADLELDGLTLAGQVNVLMQMYDAGQRDQVLYYVDVPFLGTYQEPMNFFKLYGSKSNGAYSSFMSAVFNAQNSIQMTDKDQETTSAPNQAALTQATAPQGPDYALVAVVVLLVFLIFHAR